MPTPPLPDELQRVLANPNPAIIGTVTPDGAPNTVATLHGTITLEDDERLKDIDRISKHYMGNPYSQRDRGRVTGRIEVDSWHAWNGGKPWHS
jgi:hypothetical protein